MEDARQPIVYPTVKQICEVNRRMVEKFGGSFFRPDNLTNSSSLEYILEILQADFFGQNPYPTLIDKAATLTYQIITRHVFFDGNKRTAIHVAWEFLNANGVELSLDDSIVDLTIDIANGTATEDDLLSWLQTHT